jgi:hypothetical protein
MSRPRLLIAALALAVLTPTAPAAANPARVTFVGDSVPAAMSYSPAARAVLSRRLRLRFDLRVCRRLVAPSCPYQGATPSTALQAVRALGRSVGDVLVVDVGYNDTGATYGRGMRSVVRAARGQGARAVVWVTLRQAGHYRSEYVRANTAIRTEAARWGPHVVLADWNAFSAGATFFSEDGLHLSGAGAMSLARFLRPPILRAARVGP